MDIMRERGRGSWKRIIRIRGKYNRGWIRCSLRMNIIGEWREEEGEGAIREGGRRGREGRVELVLIMIRLRKRKKKTTIEVSTMDLRDK